MASTLLFAFCILTIVGPSMVSGDVGGNEIISGIGNDGRIITIKSKPIGVQISRPSEIYEEETITKTTVSKKGNGCVFTGYRTESMDIVPCSSPNGRQMFHQGIALWLDLNGDIRLALNDLPYIQDLCCTKKNVQLTKRQKERLRQYETFKKQGNAVSTVDSLMVPKNGNGNGIKNGNGNGCNFQKCMPDSDHINPCDPANGLKLYHRGRGLCKGDNAKPNVQHLCCTDEHVRLTDIQARRISRYEDYQEEIADSNDDSEPISENGCLFTGCYIQCGKRINSKVCERPTHESVKYRLGSALCLNIIGDFRQDYKSVYVQDLCCDSKSPTLTPDQNKRLTEFEKMETHSTVDDNECLFTGPRPKSIISKPCDPPRKDRIFYLGSALYEVGNGNGNILKSKNNVLLLHDLCCTEQNAILTEYQKKRLARYEEFKNENSFCEFTHCRIDSDDVNACAALLDSMTYHRGKGLCKDAENKLIRPGQVLLVRDLCCNKLNAILTADQEKELTEYHRLKDAVAASIIIPSKTIPENGCDFTDCYEETVATKAIDPGVCLHPPHLLMTHRLGSGLCYTIGTIRKVQDLCCEQKDAKLTQYQSSWLKGDHSFISGIQSKPVNDCDFTHCFPLKSMFIGDVCENPPHPKMTHRRSTVYCLNSDFQIIKIDGKQLIKHLCCTKLNAKLSEFQEDLMRYGPLMTKIDRIGISKF